jgi:hypothetical protein
MPNTKTISYDARIRLFWLVTSAIGISFVLYVYAIHATTRHIAEMGSLGKEITALSAEQGTLEFTYIELKNKITLETATQYGLAEVQTPIYVSRSHSTSLTMATREAR